MAVINYQDARDMVTSSHQWMSEVSAYFGAHGDDPPKDLYPTQKLAFEISKTELANLMSKERVVGILCMEPNNCSLSIVFVGVDDTGTPDDKLQPCQTWPTLYKMSELQDVLTQFLTP